MPKVSVNFQKILQDTQDYNCFDSNNAHMVSKLFFVMDVGGEHYKEMFVEIRQPYGTDFESTPIEVGSIQGSYRGPWDQSAFSDLCEAYYRRCVGASGCGINIQGGSNIRMTNNTFVIPFFGEFNIPNESGGSW